MQAEFTREVGKSTSGLEKSTSHAENPARRTGIAVLLLLLAPVVCGHAVGGATFARTPPDSARRAHSIGEAVVTGGNLIQVADMRNANTGGFINKGVEVSMAARPLDNLTLHASYGHLHTSLDGLTSAPRNQYFLGAGWQALPGLRVDAELRGTGGLYVADDVERQDYALLDMKLTYKALRFLEVFITLDNVTHARYVINKGYDMPGFTAAGGVRLHLGRTCRNADGGQ